MAELVFPAAQITNWTANVYTGVIGGIPTGYTQHGSTIAAGSGDQKAEIQAVLDAASPGNFVLLGLGTFELASTLNIPTGVILRGSSQTGTILSVTAGTKGIYCGSDSNYDIGNTSGDAVTAGNTRFSDTVTIADTSAYTVGDMIFLQASDTMEPDLPIFSVTGQVNIRAQICRLESKTGTTLTFFPPLHADWSNADLTAKRFTAKSQDAGLENLTVDCLTSGVVIYGVQFEQTLDCWIKNVTVKNANNYNIHIWHDLNTELHTVEAAEILNGGSNGAGILHESSCQTLIVNSISFESFPNLEWWGGGNMGNAVAYCMMDITAGAGILGHNACDAYNVMEGNCVSSVQLDGYFGPAYRITFFRNYLFGIRQGIESGEAVGFAVSVNRTNRYSGFVGNYFAAEPSYGNPNIGIPTSSGVVTPTGCQAQLTTRTSATVGTITGPVGHTVTTGATINIYWSEDIGGSVQVPRIRRDVTVGTVSGQSIPFSGGLGDDLPADESTVFIPTTNDALRVWWAQMDENGSTLTGTLTTRVNDGAGTFTISGTGTIADDNWPTSLRWSGGFRFQMTVDSVVGPAIALVSINNAGGSVLPIVTTAGALFVGPNGYQEQDLDALVTAWSIGNWWASEGGIPSWESLGGDTLQDSLIFPSAPSWMSGYTYPFNPNSGTASAEDIPAGDRYLNGIDPEETVVNVTTLNVTTLTVG